MKIFFKRQYRSLFSTTILATVLFCLWLGYSFITLFINETSLLLLGVYFLLAFNVGFMLVWLIFCVEYKFRYKLKIGAIKCWDMYMKAFNKENRREAYFMFFGNFLSFAYVANTIIEMNIKMVEPSETAATFLFGMYISCVMYGVVFLFNALKFVRQLPMRIINQACFRVNFALMDLATWYLGDINSHIEDDTPLKTAVTYGTVSMVEHLMNRGADPLLVVNGVNALDFSRTILRKEMYDYIQDRVRSEKEMSVLDGLIETDHQSETLVF